MKKMKKIVLIIVGILFLLVVIGSMGGNNKKSANPIAGTSTEIQNSETKSGYKDGTYLVGEDIQPGLYRAIVSENALGMGYVERAKDVNMEVDSIIANVALTGNGYIEIKATDKAVKVQGAELVPIKLEELTKNIQNTVGDGIYLIGYDLEPGTYKVVLSDNSMGLGYVERARSVAMGVDDIIANDAFQGPGYVKIEKGDFAIKLQGVKITKKN